MDDALGNVTSWHGLENLYVRGSCYQALELLVQRLQVGTGPVSVERRHVAPLLHQNQAVLSPMEGVYLAAVLVMDCLDEALEDGFDRFELAGIWGNGRDEDGHGHSLIRG